MAKLDSMNVLRTALANGWQSVKELHTATSISESRIRELLKMLDGEVEANPDTKPMTFILVSALEEQVAEEQGLTTQEEEGDTQEGEEGEEPGRDMHPCPGCNGTDTAFASDDEDSYLGSVLVCAECGKAHNILTGAEVPVPPKAAKAKKRHKNLNPQKIINRKRESVEEAGGTLEYSSTERLWTIGNKRKKSVGVTLTSKELAEWTAEELVAAIPE